MTVACLCMYVRVCVCVCVCVCLCLFPFTLKASPDSVISRRNARIQVSDGML